MRHRKKKGNLTVTSSHQRAMGRNLVASLFQHGKVTTTVAKAKTFRPFAEKLVTLARKGNARKEENTPEGRAAYLHAIRRAARILPQKPAVRRLFRDVAPSVGDRPGGYTRIVRLSSSRLGDNAPKALLMLVDPIVAGPTAEAEGGAEAQEPEKKSRRAGKKAAAGT